MGNKAIITVGPPASGKTTFAEDIPNFDSAWIMCERDIYRRDILTQKGFSEDESIWKNWKWKWEKDVDFNVHAATESAVKYNKNIIFSDTNLNIGRRESLQSKLEHLGFEVEIIPFGLGLSLDELWKRDLHRLDSVGHAVIARYYYQFRKEFPKYDLKDSSRKQGAVLVDLDGTLFNMGDRSPYDWHKVDLDIPNRVVVAAIKSLYESGVQVIFLSGRDGVCWDMSWQAIQDAFSDGWEKHDLEEFARSTPFYIRPKGDQRKDSIIKWELFDKHVNGFFNVIGVFDDRPSVTRDPWYELGFRVYHCANPYLEF